MTSHTQRAPRGASNHAQLRMLALATITLPGLVSCAGGAIAPSAVEASADEPSATASSVSGTTELVEEPPAGALEVQVSGMTVAFQPDELTAPAGTIVIFIHNETTGNVGEAPHNIQIGVDLPPTPALVGSSLVRPGESATFTVTGLEPGTYRFWCSYSSQDYGSHDAAGMVGTLTVTP